MKADPYPWLIGVTREEHACSVAGSLFAIDRTRMILFHDIGTMEASDLIRNAAANITASIGGT